MKSYEQSFPELLDEFFARVRKLPPRQPNRAWEQVIDRFAKEPEGVSDDALMNTDFVPSIATSKKRSIWLATAAVVSFAVVLSLAFPTQDVQDVPGAFDVASIRPTDPLYQGSPSCGPIRVQVNPARFVATNASLCSLIALAYGNRDLAPIAPSVEAHWVRSEKFDIEATIPGGTPSYTLQQVVDGQAPVVQKMLQALLADRFQLVLVSETKEMPVFNLIVTKAGKLTADRGLEVHELTVPSFHVPEISMKGFARVLQGLVRQPVVDKTNLTGSFDILLEFRPLIPPQPQEELNSPTDPIETSAPIQVDELQWQLQEQLGLKLESGRAPVEILVIDHADRPTPN